MCRFCRARPKSPAGQSRSAGHKNQGSPESLGIACYFRAPPAAAARDARNSLTSVQRFRDSLHFRPDSPGLAGLCGIPELSGWTFRPCQSTRSASTLINNSVPASDGTVTSIANVAAAAEELLSVRYEMLHAAAIERSSGRCPRCVRGRREVSQANSFPQLIHAASLYNAAQFFAQSSRGITMLARRLPA
jgi:hypothetical protein